MDVDRVIEKVRAVEADLIGSPDSKFRFIVVSGRWCDVGSNPFFRVILKNRKLHFFYF